jgi:zinc protease
MRTDALDRTVAPVPGAMRPFDFPEVNADALDTGLALRVSKLARLPLATVTIVLDAGETGLPAERAGLAVLSGDGLEGGTEKRSGADLAEALEGIGATLGIGTGWEATTISMSCLADRLDQAMGLLAELTLQPAFPSGEIDRLKQQRLASIQQRAMDPGSLAADWSAKLFYAEGDAYGRPLGGTVDSVGAISSEAAAGFAESQYAPGSAGVIAVGDLDAAEFRDLTERHFGAWARVSADRPADAPSARTTEREIVIVDRPGAVQSEIRIGHIGTEKSSPDRIPLVVMNTILGGSFTSRLNLNLREKNGFTYGVRSGFSFRRQAGPFSISTAVSTEQTADAVREAMSEVVQFLDGGPTREELDAARDYLAGIFPLQLETTGQIASHIAQMFVYDLPDDYYSRYRDRIRSVEFAPALEASRRHIRPAEMTILVVGDAEALRGPLEELGLGPVRVESR